MNNIEIYPHFPIYLIGFLVLLCLIITFISYKVDPKVSLIKAISLFILLFALINPKIISEKKVDIPDTLAVITDLSPSQEINERKVAAKNISQVIHERLNNEKNLEIRSKIIEGKNGTKIFGALSALVGDVPRNRLSGAIIITDGQIHDIPKNLESYNFKSPIHFIITGNKDEEDRRIIINDAPRFGIVGEDVSIHITVEDSSSNSQNALVSVSINGDEAKTKAIPIGEKVKLTFLLEKPGITNLNISVEEGQNELTLKNNRTEVAINAIRDRLRVMLVSGEPNMGLRSWRNLLKSDPSVDLMHFTILRPPNKQDLTPVGELSLIPFPTRELFQLNLKEFDLIIFDQYHLRGILPSNYLKNIVEYVVKGGALLDAAGTQYAGKYSLSLSPLQNILPTEPTGQIITEKFIPKYTDEGIRHPVTSELNNSKEYLNGWGPWYRMVEGIALKGDVLLEGNEGRPLLILNRVGRGRVAQILSDQSWVWTKSDEGKGPQADLLRRLIHWLMKEPDLEENDVIAKVKNNNINITRNSLTNDKEPVELISPSGKSFEVTLEDIGNGKQTGNLKASEEGIWKLSSNNRLINLIVGHGNYKEFQDVRATDSLIKQISEQTDGKIIWAKKDYKEFIPKIEIIEKKNFNTKKNTLQILDNEQYYVKGIEQISLAHWIFLLLTAVVSIFAAWYRESK